MQNLAKGAAKGRRMELVQIQDHELRQVGLSRKKFAELSSKLQEQVKISLENRGKEEDVESQTATDDELKYIKISREEFKTLSLWFQKHLKRFAKDGLRRQEEEKEKQPRTEASSERRQLQLGFCDTLKPSLIVGNIKTALAVDKNRLFVVGPFPGRCREYKRQIRTPRGELLTQSILIGRGKGSPNTFGVLTQSHQLVMYEVFRLWAQSGKRIIEIDGRPRAFVIVTPHQLVTNVCNSTSRDSYSRVRTLVRELATIPITIQNAYTRNGIVGELEFTVFGEMEWRVRCKRKKGEENSATDEEKHPGRVYIQVSAFATECFLHGYVKEFSLKTYKEAGGIKRRGRHNSTASALYGFLDTELTSKDTYNISLANLFAELGLCAYEYKSKRKEKIDRALETLNGEIICGDKYRLHIYLRPSENQSDYILVAKRIPAPRPVERTHSAITVTLSRFLNAKLTTKHVYSNSLVKLFSELGIRSYKYKGKRKQVIDHALEALNGKAVNDENCHLQTSLRLTSNRGDYILTAKRIQAPPPTEVLADAAIAALYAFLDDKLATKDTYNIDLVNLLPKLGLRSYKYKNKRKEKLEHALNKLEGKAIRGGDYRLQVYLHPSNDHSDYILAAKRI